MKRRVPRGFDSSPAQIPPYTLLVHSQSRGTVSSMKATIFTNVAVFTAFVSAYPGFRLWGSPTTPSQAQAQITAPPIARRLFANDTNPPGNYTIPPSNSTTALPTTTRTPQEPTYSPLPYETPLPALPEGYYPTQGVPANCKNRSISQ